MSYGILNMMHALIVVHACTPFSVSSLILLIPSLMHLNCTKALDRNVRGIPYKEKSPTTKCKMTFPNYT